MNIALVSTPFVAVPPPAYGGTELIVATLALELRARGHHVLLYATGDSSLPGVEIRSLYAEPVWPPNPWHELNHAAFAVRDILTRDDVDLVHAHVAAVVPFAPMLDVPTVCTLHHAYDGPLHELYRGASSSSLTLVAISRRQADLLGRGLEAEVVHHGLRVADFPPGPGGPYAAFIGRFAREKGVGTALEVARHARVPIRLAGRPHWTDEEYFRAEVEPRLGTPGVDWIGPADHAAKNALLGGACATLFPIDWEEPFGLVMIESMLCGTPVITFARGSAPEVIDPGVTGWIVEDPDQMTWRLSRLATRGGFDRDRCRRRAIERFASGVMAERYLDLYRAAVSRAAGTEARAYE